MRSANPYSVIEFFDHGVGSAGHEASGCEFSSGVDLGGICPKLYIEHVTCDPEMIPASP